jgi:hypothetical protein
MTGQWMIWAGVLALGVAAWCGLRRPFRQVVEEIHVDRACEQFHRQREWLEARFLTALGRIDPAERLRWEEAHWHDEIVWARDRQSRHLLALIGVHFDAHPFDDPAESVPRHATALFEFRQGRWAADGKRLDAIRPDEAFLRHQRLFEPLAQPQRPS